MDTSDGTMRVPASDVSLDAIPTTRTLPDPQRLIDIGKGVKVPLGLLLTHWNKRCPDCTEGWIQRPAQGRAPAIRMVCGCCVVRFKQANQRSIVARSQPDEGAIVVDQRTAQQREAAARRIARLSEVVADCEAQMAERTAKFDAEGASLVDTTKNQATAIQDFNSEITRKQASAEFLRGELAATEERLTVLRAAIKGDEDAIASAEEGKQLSEAMVSDLDREQARRREAFEKSTSRLRADLKQAQRRLATAKGYNPEVAGGES